MVFKSRGEKRREIVLLMVAREEMRKSARSYRNVQFKNIGQLDILSRTVQEHTGFLYLEDSGTSLSYQCSNPERLRIVHKAQNK